MADERLPRPSVTVTADDFGSAASVNEAVEIAHRDGILDAASLMVAGEAAADAVERARRRPTLRVGLHLVVVDGRPTLPVASIPALLDVRGRLRTHLFAAGVRFFCLPQARRQLLAEVRAQFEAFRATGIPLDHVNGHRHMHLHPTVLGAILDLAREFGVHTIRVPREPLRALRGTPILQLARAAATSVLLAPWLVLMRWRLRRAGIASNAYVLGLSDTGAMSEDAVLRLIAHLPAGVTELYFHPAVAEGSDSHALPRGADRHAAELAALLSPRVRRALQSARERCARGAGA